MKKKLKKLKRKEYSNATVFKYGKSKVNVATIESDGYMIEFSTISDDHRPRGLHKVVKNRVFTGIKLSNEAAISLMIGLRNQLAKSGIIQ